MSIIPSEAYDKSIEGGIKYIDMLIENAVNRGLLATAIGDPHHINPKVLEHFEKLGYAFNENKDMIGWGHIKPAFNQ